MTALSPTHAPLTTRDFDFFFQGLREGRLLVQRCNECGTRRHPAGPMCPACQSLKWAAEPLGDRGQVHSYVIHHHPPLPDYATPHVVVLVDMGDGIRVTGALAHCPPENVSVGMPVRVEFVDHGNGFWLHRFRPWTE